MNTIVKSFSKSTPKQIEDMGLTTFISWDRLRPYLYEAIGKRENETIEGIVVDQLGINVKLSMNAQQSLPNNVIK